MTRQPSTSQVSAPSRSPVIGPERFQTPGPVVQRGSRLASAASALVLLLLVVGVPGTLIALGGVPGLPTSWPTSAQLTGVIGVGQLISVLLWVVWIAWLQFTVCVLVEVRSAWVGIGVPARVPLAGPSQRLARTLVASALLLVTVAGQATALAPGGGPHQVPAAATVTVSQAAYPTDPGAEVAPVAAPAPSEQTYWLGDLQLDQDEGAALVGRKVYVVRPPEGRYHDNLWDIAERTMVDGRRYAELFELNKGRQQADGQELTLARLIQPGWLMVVPEDAQGVARVEARAAEVAPVEVPPGQVTAGAPAVDVGADAVSGQRDEAADAAPVARDHGGLVGAGILAAGLLALLEGTRRRRRTAEPDGEVVELEVALRIGADPRRAARLDAALRSIGATHQAERRALPPVYAARVDDGQVELWCAPAAASPPAPWTARDGGRRWVLDASADRAVVGARAAVPFPGLVSVGRDEHGADLLVDLEAAQGPIEVVGEGALDVVNALAAELATNPWSAELEVHGVGLPAALGVLGERYRAGDSGAVLGSWAALPVDREVLTGRVSAGSSSLSGRYLLLGETPDEATVAAVAAAHQGRGRSPWAVVCAGTMPGARWRFELVGDELHVPALGMVVRANRLSAHEAQGVAALLAPAPEPGPGSPAEGRPGLPEPSRQVSLDALFTAPVSVRVLGAPEVLGAGPIDADRLDLATEVVVHVALHPDGVHPAVLAAEVWPRGVTADVVDATLVRAAEWLGTDPAGRHHLDRREDGRWALGPAVALDWDVVLSLLARSRTARDMRQEREDLADALDLGRAAVLARRPAGRYSWLARARLERLSTDLLVDAAHRLAEICGGDRDPVGAVRAAREGLRVAPLSEVLWRDLLRASHALGGPDAVRSIAGELEAVLHRSGVTEVPPATVALLEELVPSRPDRAAQG